MPGITSTGWESKDLETIEAEIKAQVLANVSPNLNLSATSVDGQTIGASASQISQLWEAGEELYSQRDPETATGDALDQLLKLVVGPRLAATPSTVLMTITLAAGTYPAGSLIVYPSGNPDARFSNDEAITTAGATLTGQAFSCETEGATVINANTLTQIAAGVGLSAPNNPAAAATGEERETDAQYRIRWRESLAASGSCTVDAIRADLLAVTNVLDARVVENTTDAVVNGIASRGIGAYVRGGTDADVAAAIWEAKAAGIETSGTTSVSHTDNQGTIQTVRFTRVAEVPLYAAATVKVITGQYPDHEFHTVEGAIHRAGQKWNAVDLWDGDVDGSWGSGEDILINKIRAAIMRVHGVVDITSLTIDTVSPAVGTSNIPMDLDEYGDFDFDDIDVTLDYVTSAP